ncbi:phosphotransferase family protein [Gordonia polyisoprenivorans]|uniref:phosphotransferase family protein n=1 Tax=Gordonia polyisoprenivorans TaxID=84595 RepID=UPI001AD6E88A|nr:phosphotransferase family protein [Gordonia polyisoprenivorans]QTI71094.1 phosphotransferase family protein [Gordonia polyisoprenivorans]
MSETDVAGAGLTAIAEVDPVALLGWLRGAGIEWAGTVRCTRVGVGQSNLTYLLTDDSGGRWVLRRPPVGTLLASAHDVVREARILSALAPTDVAVPAVLGACTDESVSPVPLVVMEFVDGVVLDRLPAAQALSPAIRRAVGESMIDTLARIHDVDIEQVGLADLASHKPYAARQLKRWSAQWEKSKTREIPALDELTRRLSASAPEQRETRLVHGDFHIRNVMIDPDSGTVRAALDWELSTLGDPLADIGSTLAYWPAAGEPPLSAAPVELLEGFPSRDDLAAMYLDRTGRDATALRFWHALGLWKVAIIAEGVLRRARDNPANRAAAGVPTDEVIDGLVARAIAVADAAGLG